MASSRDPLQWQRYLGSEEEYGAPQYSYGCQSLQYLSGLYYTQSDFNQNTIGGYPYGLSPTTRETLSQIAREWVQTQHGIAHNALQKAEAIAQEEPAHNNNKYKAEIDGYINEVKEETSQSFEAARPRMHSLLDNVDSEEAALVVSWWKQFLQNARSVLQDVQTVVFGVLRKVIELFKMAWRVIKAAFVEVAELFKSAWNRFRNIFV